jgi:hypothetical protein
VPFIRFTRDKRGNETMLVLHAYRGSSGAQRGRVLYLFHSPSNLKLGRQALDAEVREALEHTHPDLVFDWPVLLRDSAASRVESRVHARPATRPARPDIPARRPEPPRRPDVEDATPLGRVLGAETAARLRRSHRELLERINRRARTPEERDRLIADAARLNPDEWPDEAAMRSGAASFERDAAVVASALPSRRRGRRGGRRGRPESGQPPSEIIEAKDETDGSSAETGARDADRRPDDGGDGGGEPGREPESPAADPAAGLPSDD